MNTEIPINLAAAAALWLTAGWATVLILDRQPAIVRRAVCRLAFAATPVVNGSEARRSCPLVNRLLSKTNR